MIEKRNVHNHSIINTQKEEGVITVLKIGAWFLDPKLKQIKRGKEIRKLQPKVMEFLTLLIERPGQAIERRTLEDKLWPATTMTPECLNNLVLKLRRAFGDDSKNPIYLETIPRFGVRLLAPVKRMPQTLGTLVYPGWFKSFATGMAAAGVLMLVWTTLWPSNPDQINMAFPHISGEDNQPHMMSAAEFKKNLEDGNSEEILHVFIFNEEKI